MGKCTKCGGLLITETLFVEGGGRTFDTLKCIACSTYPEFVHNAAVVESGLKRKKGRPIACNICGEEDRMKGIVFCPWCVWSRSRDSEVWKKAAPLLKTMDERYGEPYEAHLSRLKHSLDGRLTIGRIFRDACEESGINVYTLRLIVNAYNVVFGVDIDYAKAAVNS